jgi:pimeloyl-ACP methyl ester carboxylesterase
MQLNVNGAAVHAWVVGAGPPTLFLHGNPDTHHVWDGVIARLKDAYRCMAPDLPGFGQSAAPPGFGGELPELARWVQGLVDALHIQEPANLVVHDFGGLFGIAWAIRHPERVRRLAILNTVFFPEYRWHFWARIWRIPLLGELTFALNTRRALALEMRRGSKALPVAYAHRAYDSMTPSMRKMVLRLYRTADPEKFAPWQEGLHNLMASVPACVLWGDLDPYIAPSFAERFGAAEVHHFPNAGHWLAVEQPEIVAGRLSAFLKPTSA